MRAIIAIWINCPSELVAEEIGRVLIDRRLAAASNLHPAISSRYHWKGRVEVAREVPLLVKTRRELFDAVRDTVRGLHPYETPGIFGVDVVAVDANYADWVYDETVLPDAAEDGIRPNGPPAGR